MVEGALATAVVVLLVTAAAFLVPRIVSWVFRQSLPQTDGSLAVEGAEAAIEIIRDVDGVPHIYAATPPDAYFGLGFVHAQDRLWQMECQRRLASGRLSEIFGSQSLRADRLLRTFGLRRAAQSALEALPIDARATVDAYARGINACLSRHRGIRRPPEFVLLGVRPDPWEPVDVLALRETDGLAAQLYLCRRAPVCGPRRAGRPRARLDGAHVRRHPLAARCNAAIGGAARTSARRRGGERGGGARGRTGRLRIERVGRRWHAQRDAQPGAGLRSAPAIGRALVVVRCARERRDPRCDRRHAAGDSWDCRRPQPSHRVGHGESRGRRAGPLSRAAVTRWPLRAVRRSHGADNLPRRDDMPRMHDPAAGFVVAANAEITPAESGCFLGRAIVEPYRQRRIAELLAARPLLSCGTISSSRATRSPCTRGPCCRTS